MHSLAPKLPMPHIAHPLWAKPLCFFDTETTGLYPGRHEVIEAAFILTPSIYDVVRNGWSYEILDEVHTLIKPTWKHEPLEACSEALEINGFIDRLNELEAAPTISEVEGRIRSILRATTSPLQHRVVSLTRGAPACRLGAITREHGFAGAVGTVLSTS